MTELRTDTEQFAKTIVSQQTQKSALLYAFMSGIEVGAKTTETETEKEGA